MKRRAGGCGAATVPDLSRGFHLPTRGHSRRMSGVAFPTSRSADMFLPSRRAFLAASLAGLASASGRALGADPSDLLPKLIDDAPFQPSTLFLTWQRDPTTTMTVQWVGATGETAETTVT